MKTMLPIMAILCLALHLQAQSYKTFNILAGNPGSGNQLCFISNSTGCAGATIGLTNGIPSGNNNVPYGAAFDATEGKLYYSKPGTTSGTSVFNVYNNAGATATNTNISTITGGEYFRMGVGQDGNVYGTITATVATVSSSPRIDIRTVKLTRYNPATNVFSVQGNIQCPAAYASTMPAPYNDGNYWSASSATTPYYAAQLGSAGYGDLVISPDNTMYISIGKKLVKIPDYRNISGTGLIPSIEVGNILPAGVGYNFSFEGPGTYGLSWDYDNNNLLVISSRTADGADGSYNISPVNAAMSGVFRVNCLSTPTNANFADLTQVFSSIGCANRIMAVQLTSTPNKYHFTFQLRIENIGESVLKNVQLVDNFQNTFPGLAISGLSASFVSNPSGLVLNSSYNGTTNTNLFDGTKTLYGALYKGANLNGGTGTIAPGSNYAVVNVSFDVSGIVNTETVFSNTANATGLSFDGSVITDASNNGGAVENGTPNFKANDAGEDSPTLVVLSVLLPVRRLEASATMANGSVLVKWITENEINTRSFMVERSMDNRQFTELGQLPAAGNDVNIRNYSFTDVNVPVTAPVIYYRIRLVDRDGKITYSNVVAVRISAEGTMRFWPNPVKDQLTISMVSREAKAGELQISDMSGKMVYRAAIRWAQGSNQLNINGLSGLSPGMYLVQMREEGAGWQFSGKIIKQ